MLVTVIVREGHRAVVSKPTMKAKGSKTQSSRKRSAASNGAWGAFCNPL